MTIAPTPAVTQALRLLQASSCFRDDRGSLVCASLPCACAESLAALSRDPTPAATEAEIETAEAARNAESGLWSVIFNHGWVAVRGDEEFLCQSQSTAHRMVENACRRAALSAAAKERKGQQRNETCPACGGLSIDRADNSPCDYCHGTGKVKAGITPPASTSVGEDVLVLAFAKAQQDYNYNVALNRIDTGSDPRLSIRAGIRAVLSLFSDHPGTQWQGIESEGWKLVPVKLTAKIACALEMCGPPASQTPEAMERLVKDYADVWSHVLAAVPSAHEPVKSDGMER